MMALYALKILNIGKYNFAYARLSVGVFGEEGCLNKKTS